MTSSLYLYNDIYSRLEKTTNVNNTKKQQTTELLNTVKDTTISTENVSNNISDYISDLPSLSEDQPLFLHGSSSTLRPLVEGMEPLPPPFEVTNFDFESDVRLRAAFTLEESEFKPNGEEKKKKKKKKRKHRDEEGKEGEKKKKKKKKHKDKDKKKKKKKKKKKEGEEGQQPAQNVQPENGQQINNSIQGENQAPAISQQSIENVSNSTEVKPPTNAAVTV